MIPSLNDGKLIIVNLPSCSDLESFNRSFQNVRSHSNVSRSLFVAVTTTSVLAIEERRLVRTYDFAATEVRPLTVTTRAPRATSPRMRLISSIAVAGITTDTPSHGKRAGQGSSKTFSDGKFYLAISRPG